MLTDPQGYQGTFPGTNAALAPLEKDPQESEGYTGTSSRQETELGYCREVFKWGLEAVFRHLKGFTRWEVIGSCSTSGGGVRTAGKRTEGGGVSRAWSLCQTELCISPNLSVSLRRLLVEGLL